MKILLSATLFLFIGEWISSSARGQVGVTATPVVTIPQRPTDIAFEPGNPDRFYACNKLGRVYVVDGGSLVTPPFLDLSAQVTDAGENGMLGIALDPDFASNGFVYLSYTTLGQGSGDSVVSRFTVSATDPNLADPASEVILFGPLRQNTLGHKSGGLRFGPDGMLYFALGDGWNGGLNVDLRSQDISDPRGSILRLDVDEPFPHVAAGNPLIGVPGADERIWAMGLRNPFKFGIDPVNGDLLIGDVGQSTFEELNWVPGSASGAPTNQMNFGWPCMEGPGCFSGAPAGCICTDPTFRDPATSYDHSQGCAIVAGTTYYGTAIPALEGFHIYSDFCTGTVWADRIVGGALQQSLDLTPELGPFQNAVAIVADPGGEIYIVQHFSGVVSKVLPECGAETYCQANINSTGGVGTMASPGSFRVADNAFDLVASGLPAAQFAFFVASRTPGFVTNPGGSQGNLCLSGSLIRFNMQVGQTSAAGEFNQSLDLTSFPTMPSGPVLAGDTWHFQLWHRDMNPQPTSNFTEGLAVTFCP